MAKVIAECMKSLKFSTLLEYTPQSDLLDSSHCFLRIQQVYDAMEKHDTLSVMLEGGVRELVNNAELVRRYGTWVQQVQVQSC